MHIAMGDNHDENDDHNDNDNAKDKEFPMRVFLTGGSGFLGQRLIGQLRAEGHSVVALARSTASAQTVTEAGARSVRGDLAELAGQGDLAVPPAWLDHLHDVDAVVHAAARMEFWGDDAGFRADNYDPTVALHAAAAEAGVSRFVLISASGVSIGSQRAAVVDENTDNGTSAIAYCRVKLATENALRDAASPGMTLVILRPPFIWGQGMTTMAEAVDAARKGRWMWIDHGRHIMDFVHVDNLADAIVLALTHGHHGTPYYVTDGTPMAIRDFFTALMATQGVDVAESRSVPLAIAAPIAALTDGGARLLRRRTAPPLTNWLIASMGRDRTYDISAARTDLGYRPRVSLDAGLLEMAP
jgi:nucleoside-diphosphate-sugar epimerase